MAPSTVVRFVKQGSKQDELLEKTFQEVQESCGNCIWVTEEDCLQVQQRDKNSIYIFKKFTGKAFENIVNTGNRIYGPSVILISMKNEWQLPKMPHPVHNLSMKGLIISCTSMLKSTREEVHQFIQWMCGEVGREFHDKVTHLIAGEVGSKKYMVAASLKKKVMCPEWVQAVWNENQKQYVHADSDQYNSYRCPIFQGFVMTVSGLDTTERAEVKEIIEKEGGTYSGEMRIQECTHLIINTPRGQKYEFARKWRIPIVSPAWLFDCVEARYCLDHHKYRVDTKDTDSREPGTSTPNVSRLSTACDTSRINETAMNQTMSRTLEVDPLDEIDISKVNPAMFLDGCKIFLSGFVGVRLEKLRKMINLGGGTRFSQMNESVSHVVMGDKVEAHIKLLKEAQFRPHVVSLEWIIACVKQCHHVAEDAFICLDLPQPESASPNPKAKQRESQAAMPPPTSVVPPRLSNQTETHEDMQELLSQYLPAATDTTNESALIRAADEAEEAQNHQGQTSEEVEDDDATQDPSEEAERGIFYGKKFALVGFTAEMVESLQEQIMEFEGEVVPVTSRTVPDFAVVPLFGCQVTFTAAEVVTVAYLGPVGEGNGTGVTGVACWNRYMCSPQHCTLHSTVSVVSHEDSKLMVQRIYLSASYLSQMCTEAEALLDISSNVLFTPLTLRPGVTPLEGCFTSVSGYMGTERDCLMQVAEQMGATCQDYFLKTAKNGLQPSTHLVLMEASGSKYQAAKKWGIPAIEKEWLFACLRSGKREPVEDYLIDRPKMEDTGATDADVTLQNEPSTSSASKVQGQSKSPRTRHSIIDKAKNMDGECSKEKEENDVSNMDHSNVKEDKENLEAATDVCPNIDVTSESNATVESTEASRPIAHRGKGLTGQTYPEAPPQKKAKWNGVDTPSKFLDPKKTFLPKYDLTDFIAALEDLDGPENRQPESSVDLGELYNKNLAIAMKNTALHQKLPGTPGPRREFDRSAILKMEPKGPLRTVVIAVSKKLSSQQSEYNNIAALLGADYRWTYDQSCTHFIFQGRQNDINKEFRLAREQGKIIVSPHWITMCKEQNSRVDEALFPHTYNPNLALSLSMKDTPDRKTSRATRSHIKVNDVPPPSQPQATRSRAKLQMKTPKVTTPVKVAKVNGKAGVDGLEDLDKTCSEEEMCEKVEVVSDQEAVPTATQTGGTLAREALVDDIKNLMAATKTSRDKRRTRRTDSMSADLSEEPEVKRISTGRQSLKSEDGDVSLGVRTTRSSLRTRGPKRSEVSTEPSQMVEVTWDDPRARQQQEMLAGELAKNSESFSPKSHSHFVSDEENAQPSDDDLHQLRPKDTVQVEPEEQVRIPTPDPPSLGEKPGEESTAMPTAVVQQPPAVNMMEDKEDTEEEVEDAADNQTEPRVFLLSGMTQRERDDYGALIEQLGGRMSDSPHYEAECTHLVVGNPCRNEKYLACVAAGKWVLHKSYLEACRQQNTFVQEDEHEWGSKATEAILEGQPSHVRKLARAAHHWRKSVNEGEHQQGAFTNWTVILLADHKRENGFRRLLEAGGGKVVGQRPPFKLEGVNYAFMELTKVKTQVELETFVEAGILCLKPEYVASYLMENPPPKPQQYLIAELQAKVTSESFRKRKPSEVETPNSKRLRRN